jgi:hypothetical protein
MSAAHEQGFQTPPPPTMPEEKSRAPRPVKLRPVAIGIAVLGALILVGGIIKMIPGGIATGAMVGFGGVLLFALSFIPLPVVPESDPPLSFLEKVTGIFYEPSRVFRSLRAYPHWAGALVLIVVVSQIYSFAFVQRITAERIVEHMTQKISEMGPPFAPPPERLETIRNDQMSALKNPVERAGGVLKAFVGTFVFLVFFAALSLLGVLAFGGRMNFWQSLAIIAYAALPVVAITKLLGLVILYLKPAEDLHPILNQETTLQDNLGILFSVSEHPVLFVMASFIGLTSFYGLWLRAKGLHHGATRVSKGAAWGVAITLFAVFLIFVAIWTSLFSGFIQ